MKVTYFQTWHRHLREGVDALTQDEAKARDEAGYGYVAVIGNPEHPVSFIEIHDGFYGVSFLDADRREYLMYSFEELEPGKVFLREAIFREYEGDSAKAARASAYRFDPSGTMSIESGAQPFQQVTVKEREADISRNWERKPRFGEYADIVRKERLSSAS